MRRHRANYETHLATKISSNNYYYYYFIINYIKYISINTILWSIILIIWHNF